MTNNMQVDHIRKAINLHLAEKEVALKNIKKLQIEHAQIIQKMKDIEKTQVLFQTAVKVFYQNLSSRLGDIITEGLSIVFPESGYKFTIEFVERRNNVEADIFLEDKEGNTFDLLGGVGGGVADFVSLLLRCTYIILSGKSNLLISDEPLKFIDREVISDAARFLRKFCEEFNFQMIVVTHIPEIAEQAEKIYKVTLNKGVSSVTQSNN